MALLDSYSEINYNAGAIISSFGNTKAGQTFIGNGSRISSVKFYLNKSGSPTGNGVAKIYSMSGGLPSSVLATSGTVDLSTLPTSPALIEFAFTDSNLIKVNDGTTYLVDFEWDGDGTSNYVSFGIDNSSPTHSGGYYRYSASWLNESATRDSIFYLYDTSDKVVDVTVNPFKNKRYFYKIYDNSGTFISTINDISDEPKFTSYINSGLGEFTFKLPRSVFNFEESTVIAQNNQLKVYCDDTDGTVLIYNGYISKYAPTLDKGKEYIAVTCLGYITETERFMAEASNGNTTLTYNSYDPTNILKDVLDKFTTAGGHVDYNSTSTALTNSTVSYEFNTYTVKEALDKCVELAPNGYYYFVDSDNIVHFKGKDATANHTFTLGKDVVSIIPEKSVENMVNRIYFTGGDVSGTTFYKKYERSSSISTYGLYAQKYIDSRVTDESTADIMAGAILDRNDSPETRTTVVIRDNNAGDGRGYDIESIKPGDTCKITGYSSTASNQWDNAIWDTDKFDYDITQVSSTVQQIMKVSYEPNKLTLEISSKLPNISHRVEDIKRNLDRLKTDGNPTQPTT